jgi:quinoprotein glucose dehydrogenase
MNDTASNAAPARPARPPRIFASIMALLGLALLAPGIYLASLGGSLYYALAGVAMIASGALLFRGRRRGAWLYGLFFLATVGWSLSEVGLDFWALIPRLGLFLALGAWLLTPWSRRATV